MTSQLSPNNRRTTHRHSRRIAGSLGIVAALAAEVLYGQEACHEGTAVPEQAQAVEVGAVRFTNARQQAAEFISYDHSIELTPKQQKVMDDALSSIPAPCCARYSIATCCCPCNLAKSTWGLSKFLIARQHAGVAHVRAAALLERVFRSEAG